MGSHPMNCVCLFSCANVPWPTSATRLRHHTTDFLHRLEAFLWCLAAPWQIPKPWISQDFQRRYCRYVC